MIAAFVTGLIGSLQCLGMCGPIALALPGKEKKGAAYLFGRFLYNLGRIFSYSILGGIVAGLGVAAAMFEMQRWFSLSLGILLIFLAIREFGWLGQRFKNHDNVFSRMWRKMMGKMMRLKGPLGLFGIGLVNGLLPCGLVYAGLFLAANSDSLWLGMAKMALFGLGTLPLMLSVSFSGKWLQEWIQRRGKMVIPVLMTALGLMFVVRGMALGIPFLSPKLEMNHANGKVKMSCCEKIEGEGLKNQKKPSQPYIEQQKLPAEKP